MLGARGKLGRAGRARAIGCVALLGLFGCDEPKAESSKASAVKAAEVPPAPPPAPAPEPEPAPKAKAPKKTLADCAPGTKVTLDNAEFEGAVRVKRKSPMAS
jgi:hypothetical protein